jgi:hypothetical protein
MRQIWALDPSAYSRHPLHRSDRAWPETNCYVDLWIELLHSAALDPVAVLPFTLAIDFEGDQWTFLKCPLADLRALYGIDVIELNVWRPLLSHLEQQLARGRVSLVDVDAFYLPDTAGTSYRAAHVKTSIGIHALDVDGRALGYFHNAGYFQLQGDDFLGVFGLDGGRTGGSPLPPYVEVVKLAAQPPKSGRTLVTSSIDSLVLHLSRVPRRNPFHRYAASLPADLTSLADRPLAEFHGYAFATFRQFGSAFELAGSYLRWLDANGERGLDPMAATCDTIAATAWTLQIKTARFISTKRPFDPAPLLDTMADAWDDTLAGLTSRYGALVHQG